jgi:hypothetical protein
MKMEKSKNYGGCLADIHTLLHMPIELITHTSNNGMLWYFIKLVQGQIILNYVTTDRPVYEDGEL